MAGLAASCFGEGSIVDELAELLIETASRIDQAPILFGWVSSTSELL